MVADSVCEEADAVAKQLGHPEQLAALIRAETNQLAAIGAPPHWRDRHAVLVDEYRRFGDRLDRVVARLKRTSASRQAWEVEWARIMRRAERINARLAQLGYEGCAGSSGSAA